MVQQDGGPSGFEIRYPPFPICHPLWLGAERLQGRGFRESHLSGHSLSPVCESHRTHVVLQRTHTPALREKPRGGSGDKKRESFRAGERDGRSDPTLDKIIRRIFVFTSGAANDPR